MSEIPEHPCGTGDLPEVCTPKQWADFFKVSPKTVYRMCEEGRLPSAMGALPPLPLPWSRPHRVCAILRGDAPFGVHVAGLRADTLASGRAQAFFSLASHKLTPMSLKDLSRHILSEPRTFTVCKRPSSHMR